LLYHLHCYSPFLSLTGTTLLLAGVSSSTLAPFKSILISCTFQIQLLQVA
jgi:hypothetical protein